MMSSSDRLCASSHIALTESGKGGVAMGTWLHCALLLVPSGKIVVQPHRPGFVILRLPSGITVSTSPLALIPFRPVEDAPPRAPAPSTMTAPRPALPRPNDERSTGAALARLTAKKPNVRPSHTVVPAMRFLSQLMRYPSNL